MKYFKTFEKIIGFPRAKFRFPSSFVWFRMNSCSKLKFLNHEKVNELWAFKFEYYHFQNKLYYRILVYIISISVLYRNLRVKF